MVYTGFNTPGDSVSEAEIVNQIQAACASVLNQGSMIYNQCLYEQLQYLEEDEEEGNY